MGGYWIDSPDNPFNQMSWTRGGGGYDNSSTHESNDRRAHAMEGAGASALPHFATVGAAASALVGGQYAVVGDNVIRTSGPGSASAHSGSGGGGSGAGSAGVTTGSGGSGAGSRLVIAAPGYSRLLPEEKAWSPGAWGRAPEIDGIANQPLKRIGIGGFQEAPGAISDIGFVRTATGYMPVPSQDVKERIEDGPLEWVWMARNQILPHLGLAEYPRPDWLDPAYSHLNLMFGEWRDGGNPRSTPQGRMLTGGGF